MTQWDETCEQKAGGWRLLTWYCNCWASKLLFLSWSFDLITYQYCDNLITYWQIRLTESNARKGGEVHFNNTALPLHFNITFYYSPHQIHPDAACGFLWTKYYGLFFLSQMAVASALSLLLSLISASGNHQRWSQDAFLTVHWVYHCCPENEKAINLNLWRLYFHF